VTDLERSVAGQDMAASLTTDLRAVYGQPRNKKLNPLKSAVPAPKAMGGK
jgi:hypothetical protein